jgi:hypothetical protein
VHFAVRRLVECLAGHCLAARHETSRNLPPRRIAQAICRTSTAGVLWQSSWSLSITTFCAPWGHPARQWTLYPQKVLLQSVALARHALLFSAFSALSPPGRALWVGCRRPGRAIRLLASATTRGYLVEKPISERGHKLSSQAEPSRNPQHSVLAIRQPDPGTLATANRPTCIKSSSPVS